MRSMTGFGRGTGQGKTVQVVAEIKTVNHKYHDISLKVPLVLPVPGNRNAGTHPFLGDQRQGGFFPEGSFPATGPATVEVNEPLLAQYLQAAHKAAKKHKLKGDLSVEALLQASGRDDGGGIGPPGSRAEKGRPWKR